MQAIRRQIASPHYSVGAFRSASTGGKASGIGPFRRSWTWPSACGSVDIWFVPAGAHADLAPQARFLDRDDWTAIARVRDADARNLLRATRITLRLALSHAVANAVKPEAWRFEASPYGKPQVAAGLSDVQFSISHIDTMAVIAVSRDAPVGVDIETLAPACDDQLIAAFCTPAERRRLAPMSGPARRRTFARLWTLKEAYAKLTGTGLAADFRFLEFGAGSEPNRVGFQTQQVPGVASFASWLTEAPGGLCQVGLAVGDAATPPERGELACFAVVANGATEARTLARGRGEQANPALS